MVTPTMPVDPKLADALREAGARVAAMTPVQRALMAARQAVSYVEGGMGVALPDDHEAKITVRALALLDRVGDAAADDVAALVEWARRNPEAWAGLRDGTAAVVLADAPDVSMIDAALDCGEGASLHEMIPAAIAAGRLDRGGDLAIGPIVAAALKESAP
jgi:hypothetical protein